MVWLAVAAVIIALGFAYSWLTMRSLHAQIADHIGQSLREQKQAGTLPPEWQGIDPDTADVEKLGDFQMQLPRGMETRLQISLWINDLWYLWAPLVVAVCVLLAMFTGRRSGHGP
jgi:hypothetical protein